MIAYGGKRALYSVVALCGVIALVFFTTRLVGDPARVMLPLGASEAQYEALRESLGLNRPLLEQFWTFVTSVIQGDFGKSIWQGVPALELVLERLPATLLLAAATMVIVVPIALTLGTLAAIRPGGRLDRVINFLSVTGVSIVDFWVALMLILIFSVWLGLFPTSGYGGLAFLVLPVATLAIGPCGRLAQIVRTTVAEQMQLPYVDVARAKGVPEHRILSVHALRNAGVGIVTVTGQELNALINGAVIVEVVFAWPGIGNLMIQAIERRDFPVVEATVFVVAAIVIAVNLAVDLSFAIINPRVRYA